MNTKNLQDTKESNDEWNEDDILDHGMFSMSNMSNMVSVSSNSNMYTSNTPTLDNSTTNDPLQKSTKK